MTHTHSTNGSSVWLYKDNAYYTWETWSENLGRPVEICTIPGYARRVPCMVAKMQDTKQGIYIMQDNLCHPYIPIY